jgi:hypothetical protein
MPFFSAHARRPLHTPDPLLNVYFACRTTGSSPPGLVVTLLRAIVRWYRGHGRSSRS